MGNWGSKIKRPPGAGVWITFSHFFDKFPYLELTFYHGLY